MKFLLPVLVISLMLGGCIPNISPGKGVKGTGEYAQSQTVKGFPSIPLYPGAQVIESYGLDDKYGASFITSDDLVKVVNFYNKSFKGLGWDSQLKKVSETNYIFDIKNAIRKGSVIVNTASDGKTTAISVSVEPR